MKKEPFQISPGFAEIDLRLQNDLLVDLIRNQEQVIKQQVKQIEELHIVVRKQTVEIEQLKSEVRRLKKLKQKPKIRPSKMNKDDNNPDKGGSNGGKRAGSEKRSKRGAIVIHQMNIIKVENVPEGSKFKGYQEYLVQGLEIKAENQLSVIFATPLGIKFSP
jgi:hypothetical protein